MTAQQGHFERATQPIRDLAEDAGGQITWSTAPADTIEKDWRAGYTAAVQDFGSRLAFVLDGALNLAAAGQMEVADAARVEGYEQAKARVEAVAIRYSADPVMEPVADQFRAALAQQAAEDAEMPCPHGGPLRDCVNPDGAR